MPDFFRSLEPAITPVACEHLVSGIARERDGHVPAGQFAHLVGRNRGAVGEGLIEDGRLGAVGGQKDLPPPAAHDAACGRDAKRAPHGRVRPRRFPLSRWASGRQRELARDQEHRRGRETHGQPREPALAGQRGGHLVPQRPELGAAHFGRRGDDRLGLRGQARRRARPHREPEQEGTQRRVLARKPPPGAKASCSAFSARTGCTPSASGMTGRRSGGGAASAMASSADSRAPTIVTRALDTARIVSAPPGRLNSTGSEPKDARTRRRQAAPAT